MLSGPLLKFCELVISGKSGEAAWIESHPGCKPASARANGARALARDNIQAEIQRLRDEAANKAGSAVLTLAEKRKFLAEIVRTPVGQVDENSPLCQSFKRRREKVGRGEDAEEWEVEEIKIADKLKALELDAKLAGEFKEDQNGEKQADALVSLMQSIATRTNGTR